jgi:AAA+ superfamily predicted ATPase
LPPLLTFSVDSQLDAEQSRLIEIDLRRQLGGLRLEPELVGTMFEIRNPNLPNKRVIARIETLLGPGLIVNDFAQLQLVLPASHSAVPELPQELRQYASTISLKSPDDQQEFDRAKSRFEDLVGLPKDEIIADVVARLRGRRWLEDWSRRHYGEIIPGATEVQRSVPFVLLAGDPGTGKSVLVHQMPAIIARHLQSQVLFVQLNERLRGTGIQGRAGTEVVNVFDAISHVAQRHNLPTLVFLDEAEAVASARGLRDDSSGAQENVAVVDALVVALDHVFARSDVRLVFVTATNLISRVDPAVLRRATIYRFTRPSASDRRIILQRTLGVAIGATVLDSVNVALERPELPLTAADVLNQVIARAVREAAHQDRQIDVGHLLLLAQDAVATAPVGLAVT